MLDTGIKLVYNTIICTRNYAYFCYKYKGAIHTAQNDTIIIQIQSYGENI